MTTEVRKEWWEPTLVDERYFARLREDYPEKAHMSDEELNGYFNEGEQKYSTIWDHCGDAYAEYEPLADAYLAQKEKLLALEARCARMDEALQDIQCMHAGNQPCARNEPDLDYALRIIQQIHGTARAALDNGELAK